MCDTVVQKLVAFSNQPRTWKNMKPILDFIFYISFSVILIRLGSTVESRARTLWAGEWLREPEREPEWARLSQSEPERESAWVTTGSLELLACIAFNWKFEAVLSRNFKILYFFAAKMSITRREPKKDKFAWRADPAVYPALALKTSNIFIFPSPFLSVRQHFTSYIFTSPFLWLW